MKISIHTLGCKVNQYESDAIQLALENEGHDVSNKLETADVFIINTCAVTNEAERKSRQVISKIKKLNPNAKVFVCGCASEKNSKSFSNFQNVSFISGVANKTKIIERINRQNKDKIKIENLPTEYNEKYFSKPSKTRAFVKIQDGCNNFCSYCIIPYLRGRSRSRNLVDVLNEIQSFGDTVKEVVLTGINISDYKIDEKSGLGRLLHELSFNDLRIRLGSLERGLISKEFVEELKNIKNLCPHFHLSLQSGSRSVLKRMNRHYTPKEFLESVKLLRKAFDNPAITTDIIVGFPGETKKEFKETLKFVKKIKFSNMHIFQYSKRDGTVAAKSIDLDGSIKKQRAETLDKINKKMRKKYIKKSKKKQHTVLLEEKVGSYYVGYTENYIKCYIKDENLLPNDVVTVKLEERYKDGVLATRL